MNKIEKFKKHFNKLLLNATTEENVKKVIEFQRFLYNYFARKGQLTEYVYCVTSYKLHEITDEILLEFC